MDDQERRVEEMIAEGLRICREAIERYKPVAIVAAYSGGDDSVVSTHFAMEHLDCDVVVNADTAIGLAPARDHIARTCGRLGWPLSVYRADPEGCPKWRKQKGRPRRPFVPAIDLYAGEWREGATPYEEYALNWGFPGRGKPQHRRMYQRLKERPFREMLRHYGTSSSPKRDKVLVVSGIRSDESANRAGYKRSYAEGYFGDVWVNPFYWRTAADFAAYRDEFGLPRNPVKPLCGISGECCCNTFANENNTIDAFRRVDPDFAAYVEDLERRVKEVFPWGYGESPPSWWLDARRGQAFLFDVDDEQERFQPMCVGCERGRR